MNNTREIIIEKAYDLFLNNSYETVSISDICQACGLTKGALYHHFINKEELFKTVIDEFFNISNFEINSDTITLKEYIKLMVENSRKILLNISRGNEALNPINYMSIITDSFKYYPTFFEKSQEFLRLDLQKTIEVFEIAKQNKEIKVDVNCKIMAEIYYSNCFGLASNLMRNYNINDALTILNEQFNEFYKILKM